MLMTVHCPYCGREAPLVTGAVIYPHRPDLHGLNFYICRPCDAYVGCHKPGSYRMEGKQRIEHDGTEPFGLMANARLRTHRKAAHAAFDPLWQNGTFRNRRVAYEWLAKTLGIAKEQCHIGMFDVNGCVATVKACAALKEKSNA